MMSTVVNCFCIVPTKIKFNISNMPKVLDAFLSNVNDKIKQRTRPF